jgi:hypothetical protein
MQMAVEFIYANGQCWWSLYLIIRKIDLRFVIDLISEVENGLFAVFSSGLNSRVVPELSISEHGSIGYAISNFKIG